ncbi:1222_t:CDS:2 [Dentiscutata erythropus]|uniref:1222_t:CDS:1 n=1 Tax=Dentiscutata erythropus TaxID=1348616 RepID=A0A9N8WSF7_9GLOM|nr:1222_t:CDS:2 [Dentiscutata erythropus]
MDQIIKGDDFLTTGLKELKSQNPRMKREYNELKSTEAKFAYLRVVKSERVQGESAPITINEDLQEIFGEDYVSNLNNDLQKSTLSNGHSNNDNNFNETSASNKPINLNKNKAPVVNLSLIIKNSKVMKPFHPPLKVNSNLNLLTNANSSNKILSITKPQASTHVNALKKS